MSTLISKANAESQSLLEAAAWLSRLQEAGADTCAAFETWLDAKPEHAAAWQQVHEPWALIGEQAAAPELVELRRAALADAKDKLRERSRRFQRVGWRSKIALAAAVVGITVGGLIFWQYGLPDVYRTAAGERRTVTLDDGSTVTLDSQSELRVRYTPNTRDLTLSRGQARFDVAHDVERPFSVVAGGQKVIATGTAFNVDLLGSTVLVTLIEGRVVVLPQAPNARAPGLSGAVPPGTVSANRSSAATQRGTQRDPTRGGSARGVELKAGEQLIASPAEVLSIEHVNVERATAWAAGELVFDNEPLSSVVARINRYTTSRVELADSATADLKISGVFHTGDVDGFVSTITSYLPLRASATGDGTIRLDPR
jgi:transmembrane sensor